MPSQETLDEYRRMTPGERLELVLRMTEENLPALVAGPEHVVRRSFELLQREGQLVHVRGERTTFLASPDELPVCDICSL